MPVRVYWDASGLAKRYLAEAGSATVNAVFTAASTLPMCLTVLGYAETFSIMLRRLNDNRLDRSAFATMTQAMANEVLYTPHFQLLTIDDNAIFAGFSLMQAYNINASDAAILAVYLRSAAPQDRAFCLLVASDQRLLRAAATEGFATLNPEQVAPNAVSALLQSLT